MELKGEPCWSFTTTYLAEVIPADDLNIGRLNAYNLGPTINPKIIRTNRI